MRYTNEFFVNWLGLSRSKTHSKIGDYPNIQMKSCGLTVVENKQKPIESRVVNGTNVEPGEFPWMASIYSMNMSGDEYVEYFCAGALINSYWILTAASCFIQPKYITQYY